MKVLNHRYIYTALLWLFLGPLCGWSQLNLLVGYDLGYYPDHSANAIFEAHNDLTDWYKTELEPLRFQHGLQLGLRYGFEHIRFTLTYRNMGLRNEAEGIPSGSNEAVTISNRFRTNNIGFAAESAFDHINYGAALEYNAVRITGTSSDLSNSFTIQSNQFWSARLYLNFEFYGDRYIGLAIQPYWSLPITDYSLAPLGEELSTSLTPDWKASLFGCSFLMTNGPRY